MLPREVHLPLLTLKRIVSFVFRNSREIGTKQETKEGRIYCQFTSFDANIYACSEAFFVTLYGLKTVTKRRPFFITTLEDFIDDLSN